MCKCNAMHQSGGWVWTGKGDSGCDVTGLNWNLHVPRALQREEKGHEIPTDWTHPMFFVSGSALV